MQRNGAGLTDVGQRRSENEDAFYFDDTIGLYVVADGMGGHAAGEVASSEAIDTVRGMVRSGEAKLAALANGNCDEVAIRGAVRVLESAVQAATYMVFGLAQADPGRRGMGTTISALALCGSYAITAQVGDSRVYLVRDGVASLLTEDHTLVAWQLKQGIITEEEAAVSPQRNVITRAVGSRDYVQVDTRFFDTYPGDTFLVCSDGLHGYLEENEIPGLLLPEPGIAAERCIQLANQRGGRDNITAIIVTLSA